MLLGYALFAESREHACTFMHLNNLFQKLHGDATRARPRICILITNANVHIFPIESDNPRMFNPDPAHRRFARGEMNF